VGRTAVGLLRALVGEIDELPPESGDQVVLQGEVDGVQYTLTRRCPQPPESELPALSSREREIARMIAKGYTNKTIAVVLEISTWTVDTHIRRIFAKLGVRTRSAMVAQLAAAGLVAAADDETPEWQAAWVRHSSDG
jgi:DNA-binding CsgD family transcriptional regulator